MRTYIFTVCVFLFNGIISDSEVSASLLHRHRQARQGLGITCTQNGYQPYPGGDVTRYVRCLKIGSKWYYYIYKCPAGSGFVAATSLCTVGAIPPTTEASTTADTTTAAVTTGGSDATTSSDADTTTPASSDSTTAASSDSTTGGTGSTDAATTGDTGATSDATSESTTTAPTTS